MGALKSKFRRSKSSNRDKGDKPAKEKKQKRSSVNLPESQSARKKVDPRLPFTNYRQIFSIRNAWKAVSRTMEDCAKETLIRLFKIRPSYQKKFTSIQQLKDDDQMRHSDDFEIAAMDIYQIFDDVIVNLEEVDKAVRDIKSGAMGVPLTKNMMKALKDPFIEVIRDTLGSDRFPEVTEDNFKLLFSFVHDEMCQYLEDGADEEEAEVCTEEKKEDEEQKQTETEIVADTQVEVNICNEETHGAGGAEEGQTTANTDDVTHEDKTEINIDNVAQEERTELSISDVTQEKTTGNESKADIKCETGGCDVSTSNDVMSNAVTCNGGNEGTSSGDT